MFGGKAVEPEGQFARVQGAAHRAGRMPQRSILAQDVYEIIRGDLLTGRIEPGSRMNLDHLARSLHVSNTPVRQALAQLESEGLVSKEAYKGFAASTILDTRAIYEMYEFRLMVEPPTAARAARHANADSLEAFDKTCDASRINSLLESRDARELGRLDIEFHGQIARLAGNELVYDTLLLNLERLHLFASYMRKDAGAHAWDQHRVILDALKRGEPADAAEAMRLHLHDAFDRMNLFA